MDVLNSTIAYNRAYGNNGGNDPPGRGIGIGGHAYVNLVNSIVYGNYWQEVQGDYEGYEISLYNYSDYYEATLNVEYSVIDGGL